MATLHLHVLEPSDVKQIEKLLPTVAATPDSWTREASWSDPQEPSGAGRRGARDQRAFEHFGRSRRQELLRAVPRVGREQWIMSDKEERRTVDSHEKGRHVDLSWCRSPRVTGRTD